MQLFLGYLFVFLIVGPFVAAQIVCHRGIKKVTNTYWFGLGISIFLLVGLMAFRFVPDWIRFANAYITDPGSQEQSDIISKAFFLDVCPFVSFVIPICLIADPSRKAARALAPISILGAFFVIVFQLPQHFIWSFEYIFVGDELFCFMHVVNLGLGIGVLLNTPRHGGKGTLITYAASIGMYIYIIIVAYSTGAQGHVSGVTLNDFIPDIGEYGDVTKFFHMPYQFMPIIYYPLGALAIILILHLNDYVIKRFKPWQIEPKYSGCWNKWYKI